MSTLAARYVHKPTEVLAVEVTPDNIERVANWCDGSAFFESCESRPKDEDVWYIASKEGDGSLYVEIGDIVVLEDDEFYAMDKDAFNERYNPLDTTHLNGVWLTNPFSG